MEVNAVAVTLIPVTLVALVLIEDNLGGREGQGGKIKAWGGLKGIEVTFLNTYALPGASWSFSGTFFVLLLPKAMICGGD